MTKIYYCPVLGCTHWVFRNPYNYLFNKNLKKSQDYEQIRKNK